MFNSVSPLQKERVALIYIFANLFSVYRKEDSWILMSAFAVYLLPCIVGVEFVQPHTYKCSWEMKEYVYSPFR